MRKLYSALVYLLLPFALLRLWWKGQKNPAYRKRWRERFGFIPKQVNKPVWVHAVSVGETIAAVPLIKKLIAQHYPVVITTMTITGAERVQALFGSQVKHYYLSYDIPDGVNRFIKRLNPRLGIIMETEIWPNLYHQMHTNHLPLVLVNARLSPRSAHRYHYFLSLFTPALKKLTHIAAQTHADAQRFVALGADSTRMSIMGNIKFDIEIPDKIYAEGKQLRAKMAGRAVWVVASTHPTEEELILKEFIALKALQPQCLLILVPRHPERFDQVAQFIARAGLTFTRRSENNTSELATVDVLLGDTMGEMLIFYAAADVALVAGSFVPIGGHNVLEPAALGVPVITGPHTFNFTEIMRLLCRAGGCVQLHSPEALVNTVNELLVNTDMRQKMGTAAHEVVRANRGAFDQLWKMITPYLRD